MNDIKLKRYQKDFEYSYTFGTYPTIDLLKYHSDKVIKIVLKKEGFGSEGVDEVVSLCEEKGIKYEVNDWIVNKIAYKENTYAMGVFKKYDTQIDEGRNHVVLAQPRNMGNLGTIIRTMVGFVYKDLAIIKPAADIFDPTIVRSAMGALFSINFEYFDSLDDYYKVFPNRKSYLFMLDGATKLEEVTFETPHSLVFGNEGSGLPEEAKQFGTPVYIEHSKEIDSLNLSIAVGIALYKSSKDSK